MVHAASYLSAGRLLHAITAVIVLFIPAIAALAGSHPLAVPAMVWLCLLALFTQLDARSRYQEYKQVRDQLIRYGPDKRIFTSLANSRCQRDAALSAARQVGYAADCRSCFSTAGYRWYHLLPDIVTGHPRLLVSAVFWRTTFFMPTYHPKERVSPDLNNKYGPKP